ncbi:hypothetical protein SNE40_015403 [Patella caerulea]|uniref:Uncharacterized protein n=1 Tax=Patella caerulea TaxID=87958 RepID=A0AAN8JM50_PATCE
MATFIGSVCCRVVLPKIRKFSHFSRTRLLIHVPRSPLLRQEPSSSFTNNTTRIHPRQSGSLIMTLNWKPWKLYLNYRKNIIVEALHVFNDLLQSPLGRRYVVDVECVNTGVTGNK